MHDIPSDYSERVTVGTLSLTADDTSSAALADGGIGLLIADGALIADRVRISPA